MEQHGAIRRKEETAGWLFATPVILGWVIFVAGPVLVTLALSLTDYTVGGTPRLVGLGNYRGFFQSADPSFFASVRATALYGVLSVPACIAVSFFLALLLNTRIRARGLFRAALFLPVIIPLAASSVIWMWLFQPDFGVVNFVIRALGLHGPQWLASERTVVPTMVLMNVWLTGNSIVIFLAALQGVPRHLYEALEVDGGNALHKLVYITLPMVSPTIFFMVITGFINALQAFVQPAIMTSDAYHFGGPGNSSLLYVLFIYREAFRFSKLGGASAAAVLLFVVIAVLTWTFFKMSRSLVYYEGGERT
ncbi:MAG TPA: sugar ABC transporter permease [Anaeromyxobacter sp.]|nr:sugar ABC transporter permease [Anaeromyxobacter sp.]